MMSRQNDCNKREPYHCAVLVFSFLSDQSGENKKYILQVKNKNADEMKFINCWFVVLTTTVLLTKLFVIKKIEASALQGKFFELLFRTYKK